MRLLSLILKDIRIEHTLFAMPFAVMSAFIASGGLPAGREIMLLLLALVFARSAAMAFNRLVDAKFDMTNPRTEGRPLASGKAGVKSYLIFVVVMSVCFIVTAKSLNELAYFLSPLALLIVFFYSLTKRFTAYSHFFLGFALALSPVGAWVAITGEIGTESLLLGLAVIFWLAGLDIIYSCQDVAHDKELGLYSIPSRFGVKKALFYSSLSHLVMVAFLIFLFGITPRLGPIFLLGLAFTSAFLWYEHSLVKPNDLRKVNSAFFNVNGIISVGLMVFVIADMLL